MFVFFVLFSFYFILNAAFNYRKLNIKLNIKDNTNISVTSNDYTTNQAPPLAHNYLNCAAPKATIAQNCNLIRQIQNNYPPYPSDLGHYDDVTALTQHIVRPTHLSVQVDGYSSGGGSCVRPEKLKKHPGILKNYKSCPVSPVHEELEWAVVQDRATKIQFNERVKSKRHTLYSDDAKIILNMIHSDTEKMIAEITQKYGDLNDYDQEASAVIESVSNNPIVKCTAKKEKHEHDFLSEDEANFSSDSLEDCSLDLECDRKVVPLKKKKTSCKKHHRKYGMPAKRSVSEYFIYEDFFANVDPNRKVSLSDILIDDQPINDGDIKQQRFLETQRHSSASFFLGQRYPDRKSQESILSDDYSGGGGGGGGGGNGSFRNSMESILSDESDCKSAPLEILFEKASRLSQKNIGHYDSRFDANNSKSYGSSPNATNYGLDYYMNQHEAVKCDMSNYGFDSLDGKSFKILNNNRSPTHKVVPTSMSVPQFQTAINADYQAIESDDFIPSMTSKAAKYNTFCKSLSKDFANSRKQTHSMYENESKGCFIKKQSYPMESRQIINSDVFNDAAASGVYIMKKSCSFEIEMGKGHRRIVSNSTKFEQNLERFEKDRLQQHEDNMELQKSDFNLEMNYVPHKPPVAHRRSSSMKGRGKYKCKDSCNTKSHLSSSKTSSTLSHCNNMEMARDFVNMDYKHKNKTKYNAGEKYFEVYIAEKGIYEDENMNSLNLDEKKKSCMENSIDSLDTVDAYPSLKHHSIVSNEESCLLDSKYLTPAEFSKFRDIEKKIDVINKLVELEERKLEQERRWRENRIKPLFDGNTKAKGFVKNLTKNFDMLAKEAQDNIASVKSWCLQSSTICVTSGMKRNYSLPDVLEGAKFQTFEFDDIDMFEAPKMVDYGNVCYDYDEEATEAEEGVNLSQILFNFSLNVT